MSWHRGTLLPAVVLVVAMVATAGPSKQDCIPVPWKELHFGAQKFLMRAETSVVVDRVNRQELADYLREGPSPPGLRPTGPVLRLRVATDLPMGRDEIASAWIEPTSGAALQREKVVSGRKNYWKLHRYTVDGLWQWRAEPASKREAKQPHGEWSKRKKSHRKWSVQPSARSVVTDPYALLYLLSAARLDREGAKLELLVPSKKGLVVLRFEAGAAAQHEVGFDLQRGGKTSRRSGEVAVRVVTGRARYLGNDRSAEDVETGFMGMRGGLTVLVQQGTGTPLEVSGRSKGIGRLVVKLERVVLR